MGIFSYILDHEPVTVRDVVDGYGETAGLARTTIQTVMERLRKKGFLVRQKTEGALQYRASRERRALLHDLIQQFVDRRLGGSVSPFVMYLADSKNLTYEEFEQLRTLVDKLEAER